MLDMEKILSTAEVQKIYQQPDAQKGYGEVQQLKIYIADYEKKHGALETALVMKDMFLQAWKSPNKNISKQ